LLEYGGHDQDNRIQKNRESTLSVICGIGIDLVKIARLKQVTDKWGERFLKRVFTEDEISYCFTKHNPYLSLSVRFAAKEALIKAIGAEFPASFTDIEVIRLDRGKPSLRTLGKLKVFLGKKGVQHIHVSLSHEHDYGIACVVLEE
jgi:holo-[acyl-carrier protein] synthase